MIGGGRFVPWMGALALVASALVGRPVAAQPKPPAAVLTGRVTNLDSVPLARATVEVSGIKKAVTTDEQGRFRIAGIAAGRAYVMVRRLGYSPLLVEAALEPGDNQLTVTMEETPQQLDAVRTEVEQTGLYGVVGDTAFDIVPGADVSLVIHKASTTTNGRGEFVIDPVKSGRDLVDVRRLGFRPRLVSIDMPAKGGRKIVVWLTPLPSGLSARALERQSAPSNGLAAALFDLGAATRFSSGARSASASREMLARFAHSVRSDDAFRMLPGFGGIRAADVGCVLADGQPVSGGLETINTDEIEMLEVMPAATLPSREQQLCGFSAIGSRSLAARGGGGSMRGGGASSFGRVAYVALIILRR